MGFLVQFLVHLDPWPHKKLHVLCAPSQPMNYFFQTATTLCEVLEVEKPILPVV